MDDDPRLLHQLLAIEKHGTFIPAADAEHISQPALSNKINTLERRLSATLIDRGRHGARLNHMGKLMLRHARALDAVIDHAAEEIELAKHGDSEPLISTADFYAAHAMVLTNSRPIHLATNSSDLSPA